MKHTKEDWIIIGEPVTELPELDHGYFSFLGSDLIIHQVNVSKEVATEKTKLIASAPELLQALIDARITIKAFLPEAFATLLVIESAINKATN